MAASRIKAAQVLNDMRLLMCGTRLGKTGTNANGDYAFPGLVAGDSVRVEPSQAAWLSVRPVIAISCGHAKLYRRVYGPAGGATNPIDEARAYVRQHYRDFLNREADKAASITGPAKSQTAVRTLPASTGDG